MRTLSSAEARRTIAQGAASRLPALHAHKIAKPPQRVVLPFRPTNLALTFCVSL